jgi:hypothetical protein
VLSSHLNFITPSILAYKDFPRGKIDMVENVNFGYSEIKEVKQECPYVVSEDIVILLEKWSKTKNFTLPNQDFFKQLRLDFTNAMRKIFPAYESVREIELSQGLNTLIKSNDIFSISLDRIYAQSNYNLDISRLVNNDGMDQGLGRRRDRSVLLEQFRNLQKLGVRKAILVDDVIFSGKGLIRILDLLSKLRIEIPTIYAGIAIRDGIKLLKNSGFNVQAVRVYEEVTDEVCERDFYPGVSFCGRSLNNNENVGIPYILPFGNPEDWASIPKNMQIPFSKFCLNQSIKLFEEIEKSSGKYVYCSDLDRKVIGLPNDDTRFTACLRQTLREM